MPPRMYRSQADPFRKLFNMMFCAVSTDFRRIRKTAKKRICFMSLCPSVRTEHLGSHRTDFHEIWQLSIFRELVEKTKVWLKSDPNNWYFAWRPTYIYVNISLNSSYNEECFKAVEKIKTHFMFSNIFQKLVLFMK
jgi:hypothetical protein